MKTNKIILILFFTVLVGILPSSLEAQNVNMSQKYIYDLSGNRIIRTVGFYVEKQSDTTTLQHSTFEYEINVYPNPAKDYIQVDISSISSENIISVQLLDLKGTELFKKENVTGPFQVEMSDFAAGMYFLNIQIDDRRIVWKVVKE